MPIKLTSILGSHISWRFRDQGEVRLIPVFRRTHLVKLIRTHFALCSRFEAGKPYYVIGVDPSTGATMFGGKLGSAGFQSKNSLRLLVNGVIQFEDNSNESLLSDENDPFKLLMLGVKTLSGQTLPLETCSSPAPPPPPQDHRAHRQLRHHRLRARTARPPMVVAASSRSSSTGRSTTAARSTSPPRARLLPGAPPGWMVWATG